MLALLSIVILSLSSAAVSAVPLDEYWLQPRDSPVTSLFHKRYTPSPSDSNFTSNYPSSGATPATSSIPSSWLAKLNSITMPNVSVSTQNNGYPTYANGESGADATICSFTYACTTKDDLLNPPENIIALSFDDGPTDASSTLYTFLAQNNISSSATHFMIGGNILNDPTEMQAAVNAGGHIAVHTWSHPYMTTLTNEQVVAELGWTMQIISDLNGGRVPKFWRPPYGDVDNRVRAIAKGVFGLETVVWNQDSADWAIGTSSQYTLSSVEATMDSWLTASNKSTGLCMLEHELNDNTVNVFMTEYPKMKSNGWDVMTVADAFSLDWYQNSESSNTDTVTSMSIGATLAVVNTTAASSTLSSSMSSTSAISTTSQMSTSATSGSTTAASSVAAAGASASASASSKSSSAATRSNLPATGLLVAIGFTAALLY